MGTVAKFAVLFWFGSLPPVGSHEGSQQLYAVKQIRVLRQTGNWLERQFPVPHSYLMRGDTYFGLNYLRPENRRDRGNPRLDFSRLATTYHHRTGPVGVVMERLNWFPGPQNTFWADARMPASIVGHGTDPWSQLVNLWSEPPYATIGIYVGETASYARPFQYADFYENTPEIVELSLPPRGRKRYFNYVQDARERGAFLRVFQGPERQTLTRKGPERFYHVIILEMCTHDRLEDLSVDLLTKEGIALCFEKLADNGVLCIHTSNRYITVIPVITDAARELGLKYRVGKDGGKRFDAAGQQVPERGLFSSEWVVLARRETDRVNGKEVKVLPPNTPEAQEAYEAGAREFDIYQYQHPTLNWYTPRPTGRHVWRDKGWNSLRGLVHNDPHVAALRGRIHVALDRAYQLLDHVGLRPGIERWRVGIFFTENPVFRGLNELGIWLRNVSNQRAEALSSR